MRERAPARRMSRFLALFRFAARDLRGGFTGLRIFLACIAIGVGAIVAVNSLSHSLEDGLARDGRVILGGDASFSLIHRELSPEEESFLASRGKLNEVAMTRAMARNAAGDATLVDFKAVDRSWPALGTAQFDPPLAAADIVASQDGVFGAAVDDALLERLHLKIGDRPGNRQPETDYPGPHRFRAGPAGERHRLFRPRPRFSRRLTRQRPC